MRMKGEEKVDWQRRPKEPCTVLLGFPAKIETFISTLTTMEGVSESLLF
jgi:hypothetical protein